ncbi:hypothetical protein [Flavobacterium sp. N2270]|jgi:hypothetical protein|uniref:hypothetical protein n=1 Tax=Flavobacterium sp. N2270 TaxID=2986831 RepID=UPI0022243426|nr:hypothetical protein [Flavobacterium sp. N2270]
MIEIIDLKIKKLIQLRDDDAVISNPDVRANICGVIEKAFLLEKLILSNKKLKENNDNQFFTANSAVNRYFREWNLDEVADIYNELSDLAKEYII